MEDTAGNNNRSIRYHFNHVVKEIGPVNKLGMKRFETLRPNFNPTLQELKKIVDVLMENSCK